MLHSRRDLTRPLCLYVSLVLLKCLVVVSAKTQLDFRWYPATATWYGDPEGDGSTGGACGYGPMVDQWPMKARVTAVSDVLFQKGLGCGTCYKVKCLDPSICSRRAVTVIAADECPNGGYCAGGNHHFDLSGAAFGHMAVAGQNGQLRNKGVVNIQYRRTKCKYPGKKVSFHVNEGSTEYWLSLLVEFEDGDGGVGAMQLKDASSPQWRDMSHVWGATWAMNGGPLKAPFSVRLITETTKDVLSAENVIPENWSAKATYTSRLTFNDV